ncbi:MAG: hypothetical protein HOP07_18795 [Bacteriovoracaceae bacterium]|nr:hypothetical protein [Bacteriovoracaceae bacterium]
MEKYNSLKGKGKIYFGDATHPLHNTILSAGWIRKGEEKEVFTNSGRNRVNVFGAISIDDLDIVTHSYDTINQISVCNFLKALRERNPNGEKIYFILDRGPSNKALSVRELAKN